mmetsp:Transcript_88199/g.273295  ORF Transcript_88199/g.273295 Transcript_88199/m.273295 type:complete len:138 (+) Transcript_88199:51-464(+)
MGGRLLFVRLLSGERVGLDVGESQHVGDVKLAIQQQIGVAQQNLHLILAGRVLEDGCDLDSCGVPEGAELILLVDGSFGRLDMNRLSSEELERHKAAMEVSFVRNQKRPGDPGYEYDVRVDHWQDQHEPCDWDFDSD